MQIEFAASQPESISCVAYGIERDGLSSAAIDARVRPLVEGAAAAAAFDGEAGAMAEIFVPRGDEVGRVLLLGLGSGDAQDFAKAGGALAARYLTAGIDRIALELPKGAKAESVARLAAAATQRAWRYDVYRTKLPERSKPTLERLILIGATAEAQAAWTEDQAHVTAGIALTRTLVTEPANILYPESFVERCDELRALGISITVLDEAAMRDLGMGALLGVSQGSRREARLLAMHWNGTGSEGNPDLAFVGKGVTFDTGGISLKPGAGMEDMKWDMGGAGAVAGTMKALALRKAKVNVVGVCGLVENMPDGNAQRPGDVVTSMSGQTIEVINTDAEGRLVLCDALTWVQRTYRPSTIVDLATLTGAMIIALGHEHGGLFSNDDSLAEQLAAAGKAVGDPVWRFPLSDAYDRLIDSPIADMKNVGPRGAGSITAAQFLARYVEPEVRWAHLDIAGMVWADKPGTTWDKGATGFGVRLLDQFVRAQFEG